MIAIAWYLYKDGDSFILDEAEYSLDKKITMIPTARNLSAPEACNFLTIMRKAESLQREIKKKSAPVKNVKKFLESFYKNV